MEEPDDYMGDLSKFLPPDQLATLNSVPADNTVEVGRSKLKWQERRAQKLLKQQELEEKHRTEGLNSAISPTNIGFKMLQQMGYTPGLALGKHGQGSTQPINVDIKRSRTGLGRDSIIKAKKEVKKRLWAFQREKKLRKQEELLSGFRERRKNSWQTRKIVSSYRKACIALSQLQEASGCSEGSKISEEGGGKIDEEDSKEDAEDDEEDEITLEALEEVLEKLRNDYFYCLYCGCQYESLDALFRSCPGPEEEDH